MESRTIGTIILGIGLNFREPETDFPDEIQSIAGTLFDKKNAAVTRNQMVAEILNRFYLLYPDLVKRSYLDRGIHQPLPCLHPYIEIINKIYLHQHIHL